MTTPTARAAHEPDRLPTEDEEAAAEAAAEAEGSGDAAEVARHYEEMTRLGVEQQGEGRID